MFAQNLRNSQGFSLLLLPLIVAALLLLVVGGYFFLNQQSQTPTTSDHQGIKQSSQTFVIGAVLPLSGDDADYGIPIKQSAQIAQKEINNQGGIKGQKVEIFFEDGKCDDKAATKAVEKLLTEHPSNINLVIGGACSTEFLAIAKITQPKKIITITSSATSPNISKLGKYVFRTAPSDAFSGFGAAEYATNKLKFKTAAIIVQNKEYPLALREVFSSRFRELGGKIVSDEIFETGTTDFSAIALKVKNANPDVVYIVPQSTTPGVLTIDALKKSGVKATLLGAEGLFIREEIQQNATIMEGFIGLEPVFDESRSQAKSFIDKYKKEYSQAVKFPNYMGGMYDLIYLIKQAAESGGQTSDQMSEYLYHLQGYEGVIGTIKFDSNGDIRLPYSIKKITSGELVEIDKYIPTSQ